MSNHEWREKGSGRLAEPEFEASTVAIISLTLAFRKTESQDCDFGGNVESSVVEESQDKTDRRGRAFWKDLIVVVPIDDDAKIEGIQTRTGKKMTNVRRS
jgi:hypothetical protein